jgi:hypothetical protein
MLSQDNASRLDAAVALAGAVPEIPERTVFFGSDPAAVRACLALASLLRSRLPDAAAVVFSNRTRDSGADFSVPIVPLEWPSAADVSGAELVFCGTSHPVSSLRFELGAVTAARAAGVRTVAFVDHWTNFRLRFEAEDHRLILPDEIWVLDAHALARAAADGLPPERLRVSGSPTLAFLSRLWRPVRSTAAIRAEVLPDGRQGPVLLYAPDPISLRDTTGTHGFDEVSAARDLAEAISTTVPHATVLLRFHPLQPSSRGPQIAEAFARRGVRAVLATPALTGPESCSIANVVIGFYSNLLLEAGALGRPVIRYWPGPEQIDPLAHLSLGRKVRDPGALGAALSISLAGGSL